MQIIKQSSFIATPWKNGGGITREAIRVPSGGDQFRWRVSVAHIDRSGPFSEFAGYRRLMVLLEGNGVVLTFAEGANGANGALRRVGDMIEFDGAAPAQCDLIDGSCTDLNLIVANGVRGVHAAVERVLARLRVPLQADQSTLMFPIDGPVTIDAGGERAALAPWDLAIIAHTGGDAHLVPHAVGAAPLMFVARIDDG